MTAVVDVVETLTPDELRELLMRYLGQAKTPVTDWGDVGFLLSIRDQVETVLSNYVGPDDGLPHMRQALVSGAFPGLAERRTRSTSDWLEIVCEHWFSTPRNIDFDGERFAATFTRQRVRVTCAAGKGPYTVTAGATWVKSSLTGNRYVAAATVVVGTATSENIEFLSESPNDSASGINYSDAAGTLTVLENPLPGLSASNLAPTFSDVTTTPDPAQGLGALTVDGSAPASATGYDIEITLSGQTGAALFKHRANGGAWSAEIATAASYTISGGPTIHFADDLGGANPSFVLGDRYNFASPGTPILDQGIDPESDQHLLERTLGRWPDLAAVDTRPKHEVWAKAASDEVVRVRLSKTSGRPGFLTVTIAGAVNPLAGGVVDAVQLYIDQHEAIGDQSLVGAATVTAVAPGGTVAVRAANLAAVQAAAEVAWRAYVIETDIGGVVRLARLDKILVDAGAEDARDLTLNAVADNLALAANAVGSPSSIIISMDWVAT